jgi:hypothetical protein
VDDRKSKLVRIYATTNAAEAHLVRNFLEQQGIQARVSGDTLAHAGLQGVANVEVYAFEEDAHQAQRLLAQDWRRAAEDLVGEQWRQSPDERVD